MQNIRGRKGFTFVEMMIVIIVIAILALIVIPRLLGQGRKAKEAMLKGDLHQLHNAIQQFEVDCGDFPAQLTQLQVKPEATDVGGNGLDLDEKGWTGPYMRTPDGKLPPDPFTGIADWNYEPKSGDVHSSATFTAIDGSKYSNW